MLEIKTWGFRVLTTMITNEYITTMFYTSSLDNNTYTTNLKYPQILGWFELRKEETIAYNWRNIDDG